MSILPGAVSNRSSGFVTRHHRSLDVLAGFVLIAVGVGDLIFNLDDIRRTLDV